MPNIEVEKIIGLITNADISDIPKEYASSLKNLIPKYGKLRKEHGFGDTLAVMDVIENSWAWDDTEYWTDHEFWMDEAVDTAIGESITNLAVYIHSKLSDELTDGKDYVRIIYIVDSSTNVVTLKYWDDGGWNDIDDLLINTLSTYYHKDAVNPIIKANDVIRFLPGNIGVVGANEAKGIWMGYINRDFFDELYTAGTAAEVAGATKDYQKGFYAFNTEVTKPDISFTKTQIPGGDFSDDTAGEYDIRYYRFSDVFDGIQEGLLSDPIKLTFDIDRYDANDDHILTENLFLKLSFTLNRTTHNKRRTGLKVYRSDTYNGIYSHIYTLEFTRKSSGILSDTSGAYAGSKFIYVPELSTYDFNSSYTYSLWVRTDKALVGGWFPVSVCGGINDTGNDIFEAAFSLYDEDYTECWDRDWQLFEDPGGGAVLVASGNKGAFFGAKTIIVDDSDLSEKDYTSGILYVEDTVKGAITVAGTHARGTVFTTSAAHDLAKGDLLTLSGFSTNTNYNGNVIVDGIPVVPANSFITRHRFGSDETGSWIYAYPERIITRHENKAFFMDIPIVGALDDVAWKLMHIIDGLYFASRSNDTITYNLYDNALIAGAAHPFQNEKSIKVNGQHAIVVQNILFLGDIVLDSGGKNEEHDDWFAFSNHEQLDVMPVSRVRYAADREGGKISGMGASFGAVIPMKKHALFVFDIPDPADDSTWSFKESKFNRGNVADLGYAHSGHRIMISSYDGLYLIDRNMLAAADETPLIEARISEKINNVYDDMDADVHMPNIITVYDEVDTRFIVTFPSHETRAYDIITKEWEQIDTTHWMDAVCNDFDGRALIYNENNQKLYSSFSRESLEAGVRTKRFHVSYDRKEPVRYVKVKYKSLVALDVNLYVDGEDDTIVKTGRLAVSETETVSGIALRTRCKSFILEFKDSGPNAYPWEIYSFKVEVD